VLPQHLPDRRAGERRLAGQALEQQYADRVQVGTLVHFAMNEAGLLG